MGAGPTAHGQGLTVQRAWPTAHRDGLTDKGPNHEGDNRPKGGVNRAGRENIN